MMLLFWFKKAESQLIALDSIYVYTWNNGSSTFVTSGKDIYVNLGILPIDEVYYDYAGGNFINDKHYTYTYDGSFNLILRMRQDWSIANQQWVDKYRYDDTFNAQNLRTTSVRSDWTGAQWLYGVKYTYTYDSNKNLIQRIKFNYDMASSSWTFDILYDYTYDVNQNRIENIISNWVNGGWELDSKYTYLYNAQNLNTQRNHYIRTGNTWVQDSYTTYQYNADNTLASDIDVNLVNNLPVNDSKRVYFYTQQTPLPLEWLYATYDKKQNLIEWSTNQEINVSQFEIEFSEENEKWYTLASVKAKNLNQKNEYQYRPLQQVGEGLIRIKQIDYDGKNSYSDIIHVKEDEKDNVLLYPTLTDGMLTLIAPDNVQIEIINSAGKVFHLNYGKQLDLSDFENGSYFVKIMLPNRKITKKITIVK